MTSPRPLPQNPPDSLQGLTPDQLAFYDQNGYLLIPNVLSPATVSALMEETHRLLTTFPLSTHPMTKFTTGESTSHVGDEYFLTSGDQVRFFFEEAAFSPTTGELTKPQHLAINKIGHNLHQLSAPFRAATVTDPTHAAIARALGFRDPRVLQSMVICKQPEIGAGVAPHQDSTFLYTDPPSAVGFWIALEDATALNGCLSVAPGSHRRTPLRRRFVRNPDGRGITFVDVQGAKFPLGLKIETKAEAETETETETETKLEPNEQHEDQEEEEEYILTPAPAGTLLLLHGNLLHKSPPNTSSHSRFIYTFHVIEGQHTYDDRNWLQLGENTREEGFTRLGG